MFAAYFTIDVKPNAMERFLQACLEEGKASVRDELECHRFEILKDRSNENRICFIEVFESEQALQAHYKTPHFAKMWQIIEPLIDGELGETDMDFIYSSDPALGS